MSSDSKTAATPAKSFKALVANRELGVGKNDLLLIPPGLIKEEPGFNERDYDSPEVDQHIEGFAKAYSQGDYVPPLIVRLDSSTGELFVVEGHCRLRGVHRAIERGQNIARLECLPFRGNDVDRLVLMLTSDQHLPLHPLGVARGYLRLIRAGQTPEEIARSIKKTRTHVDDMLLLATANADVHQFVRLGVVTASTAIEAVRKHGEQAGKVIESKLTAGGRIKSKVKPADIRDWVPPRKHTLQICKGVQQLSNSVGSRLDLSELLMCGEEDLVSKAPKTIEVDGLILISLIRAMQESEKLKERKMTSKHAAASVDPQTSQDVEMDPRQTVFDLDSTEESLASNVASGANHS